MSSQFHHEGVQAIAIVERYPIAATSQGLVPGSTAATIAQKYGHMLEVSRPRRTTVWSDIAEPGQQHSIRMYDSDFTLAVSGERLPF